MLDALKMYLCDRGLDMLYELLVRAFEVLEARDIDYDYIYEGLMHEAGSKEMEQEIADLHHETNALLDQVLTSYAVTTEDEVDLIDKIRIAEGLIRVDDYMDHDTLMNIFNNTDIESIDRAVSVLELTSEYTADKLYEKIKEANIDYFREDLQSLDLSEERDLEAVIARLRKFNEFTNDSNLHFMHLIKSGVDVGYNLELYVGLIKHHLPELPVETAAKNMIAAALASDDAGDNIAIAWTNYMESIFHDAEIIAKITVAINKLLMEFVSYDPS